jgi:hypothetical protein
MIKKPINGCVEFELVTRFNSDCDHEEYLTKSVGRIIYIEDNTHKEVVIGKFDYYYIDNVPPDAIDLFYLFDKGTQFLVDMASDMIDGDEGYKKKYEFMETSMGLIVLNTIEIEEGYRGYGLLKSLIKFFRHYHESATIILKAFPMQFDKRDNYTAKEFNPAFRKVIKAYEACGFKRVDKKSAYMFNEGGIRIPN